MPVSIKNGFGLQAAFIPVTSVIAGVNTVLPNIGAGITTIAATDAPLSLGKIVYRIDLGPDAVAGTVVSPARFRLFVVQGKLPDDLSSFQAQAFAAGSHPEIPSHLGNAASALIIYDVWIDFTVGDPGLNRIQEIDFPSGGPTVNPGEQMTICLMPIIDANMGQSVIGAANALITLGAYGLSVPQGSQGGAAGNAGTARSLPRFAIGRGD